MVGDALVVSGPVFEWRGPAPFYFLGITGETADEIREQAAAVTYGWGMVPVSCTIGTTSFTTSLWPKGAAYYLPLKDAVRRAEGIDLDDHITVELSLGSR